MRLFVLIHALILFGLSVVFCGCERKQSKDRKALMVSDRPVMVAAYSLAPVIIDGKLDEAVWNSAPRYGLFLPQDAPERRGTLHESGHVQLAWDDDHLYLAVNFQDSDIVALNNSDQAPHHRFGDLCELFLKPASNTWYWELYATPRGNKTAYFIPGRSRSSLPDVEQYQCGLRVASVCEGSVNDWNDRDQCWTAEMAMPRRDLVAHGDGFGAGSEWLILVARYNYSRYLPDRELSSTPQLPETDFHFLERYGKLTFQK